MGWFPAQRGGKNRVLFKLLDLFAKALQAGGLLLAEQRHALVLLLELGDLLIQLVDLFHHQGAHATGRRRRQRSLGGPSAYPGLCKRALGRALRPLRRLRLEGRPVSKQLRDKTRSGRAARIERQGRICAGGWIREILLLPCVGESIRWLWFPWFPFLLLLFFFFFAVLQLFNLLRLTASFESETVGFGDYWKATSN